MIIEILLKLSLSAYWSVWSTLVVWQFLRCFLFFSVGCLSVLWLFQLTTHALNGHFSGTIQASQYQKGKTNLDFNEACFSE